MARYMLVEIDDDNTSDALQAKLDGLNHKGVRIVGLFQKPKKYCECGPLTEREQVDQCTRGTNYGWIVHRPCRRPRRGPQGPRNLIPLKRGQRFGATLSLDSEGNPTANYPIGEGY